MFRQKQNQDTVRNAVIRDMLSSGSTVYVVTLSVSVKLSPMHTGL